MKEPPRRTRSQREVLRLIEQNREARKEKEMQAQLKKVALKVFSSKTEGGRTRRTFLQAFIGLSGGIMLVLAIPELYIWFESQPLIVQMGGLAGAVTAVSAVQNYAKTVWEWVK